MRVYELAENYGLTKAQVKTALEVADLPTHNMSNLDEGELAHFEAALELAEDEEEEPLHEVELVGSDAIPMVTMGGAFRENLLLEPGLARVVKQSLMTGEQVADATLYPDRGFLSVVTWPNMRGFKVRIDG